MSSRVQGVQPWKARILLGAKVLGALEFEQAPGFEVLELWMTRSELGVELLAPQSSKVLARTSLSRKAMGPD